MLARRLTESTRMPTPAIRIGLLLAGAVGTFACSFVPASANLLTNGGFEIASPGQALPTGNGTALGSGSTAIAGWTVTGTHDLAWLPNGNVYGGVTPYGTYFVDLTGYTDQKPFDGIQQTIATVAGTDYTETFAIGVIQGTPHYGGPVSVIATAGGTSQTFTANPAGSGNQWTTETLTFTATSASTTIALAGGTGDQDISIDNVSVDGASPTPPSPPPPTTVPEPQTVGLLGAAIATLVLARRRART